MLMFRTLLFAAVVAGGAVFALPRDFFDDRDALIEKENQEYLGADEVLSSNEQLARDIIQAEKVAEYDAAFLDSTYPPAQSFFNSKDEIAASKVFSRMQSMPKGGVLHIHEIGLTSADWILSNLAYQEGLCVCDPSGNVDDFRFGWFSNPESANDCVWQRVSDLRDQMGESALNAYLRSRLVINVPDPANTYPDLNTVWAAFSNRMRITGTLITHADAFVQYMTRAMVEFYVDNVQHLEIRTTLPTDVCRNMDATNCNPLTQREVAELFILIAEAFEASLPAGQFCGVNFIYAPIRHVDPSVVATNLALATELSTAFPTRWVGFDLVGQEDLGRPLIDFAGEILAAKEANPNLRLFFHAGETNWQGSTTDLNVIDALLLGAERMGHGYAIAKHPEAMRLARENDVPIEVCPVSNQVLGLVTDLRNHPAARLIQEGFPVIISSDDPATWDSVGGVSYDYYEAFMALAGKNMDLRLLKRLVFNTIRYSAMSDSDKTRCQAIVQTKWDEFIANTIGAAGKEEQRCNSIENSGSVNIEVVKSG